VPKPLQKPYPPIGIAATSERSHRWAGEQGIGVMSATIYQGWEGQAKMMDIYRKAWTRDPSGPLDRPRICLPLFLGLAPTDQQAKDIWAEPLMNYARISTDAYPRLAKIADDYAYMGENVEGMERAGKDWDYVINESASTICGSPETAIRQIERFERLGIDEIVFHIDSVPHEEIVRTIEMMGRYVIPHFNDRNNVVRPTEEILETIREMRPKRATPVNKPA
jgi:alkanesulfonate monooxygenase SsuD/methylene tetrahydromethanopterin reductase-like flavin-dependent oxidoreductase (luciferase family)